MPQVRRAEQALRLLTESSRQQYICRQCRAQKFRSYHATPSRFARKTADKPILDRMRESIFGFGSKKDNEAEERVEQKGREKTKELARRQEASGGLERRRRADGKGGVYEVAAVVDQEVNPQYVRATTWDDLERVGGVEWTKAKQDAGEKYNGYTPHKRLELTNQHWAKLLHNLAVEALVLQKAGRDINQLWYPRGEDGTTFEQSVSFDIKPTADGISLASSRGSDAERTILQAIPERIEATEGYNEQTSWWQSLRSSPAVTEESWMQMHLSDLKINLAIAKRITQLTGRRVPDPIISSARTMEDLYNAMRVRDKPKKLARTEQMRKVQVELPNVTVHSNRQTIVHKEKRVGRWKVIEAEFEARGLPVTQQNRLQRQEAIRQE